MVVGGAGLSDSKSYFTKLHSFTKLAVLFATVLLCILVETKQLTKLTILITVLVLISWALSGCSGKIIKGVFRFYPMVLFLTIMALFKESLNSEILFSILGFNIYKTSVVEFLGMNLKMIIVIFSALLFAFTTSVTELADSLKRLGVSVKIVSIVFLVNRFIAITKNEIVHLGRSFKSRYVKLSIRNLFGFASKLFATIFYRLMNRNERIYLALSSRGFNGEITTHRQAGFAVNDFVSLLLTGIIAIVIILVEG